MTLNVLTDIEWFPTVLGRKTVREVLLTAHDPAVQIDETVPAYTYAALVNFLSSIVAVCLQEDGGIKGRRAERLVRTGLGEDRVDAGLERLAPAADLFDPAYPFLQQPALNTTRLAEKATYVGPGHLPIKKLSPAMPHDNSEVFWNLSAKSPDRVPVERAIVELVTYAHLSLAGNNSYDGRKCVNGAPGFRPVPTGFSTTEIMWRSHNLLGSLMAGIPVRWIEHPGLPAWADRLADQSRTDGQLHPLWSATWTSNAPAVAWDGTDMVGVRTGGIPAEWYQPEMGSHSDQHKEWWNARNQSHPFFLYRETKTGLKVQHLDMGRNITDLAVEWAAEQKTLAFRRWQAPKVIMPPEGSRLVFHRSRYGGSSSSPNVRDTELLIPDPEQWALDQDERTIDFIHKRARLLRTINQILLQAFASTPKRGAATGGTVGVLSFLAHRRGDMSEVYWRNTSEIFARLLAEARERAAEDSEDYLAEKLRQELVVTALAAFDEIVEPHISLDAARILAARTKIRRAIYQKISLEFPAVADQVSNSPSTGPSSKIAREQGVSSR